MLNSELIGFLLEKLRSLGKLYLGIGPTYPSSNSLKLQLSINELLKLYPFLLDMSDYVEFLKLYGGLSYTQKKYRVSVDLFGISTTVSTSLIDGEGDAVSDDGILTFCSMALIPKGVDVNFKNIKGIGFGFEVTGKRKFGIYRKVDSEAYEYYCETFTNWLKLFVEKEGYMID
ncbi:MAG: hypothetical protein AB8E82_14925 [Aureispira sp.]